MPRSLAKKKSANGEQSATQQPTLTNKPMHDLPETQLWQDMSILDNAKDMAQVIRYVKLLYMGMQDQERRLKALTPEQLTIVDANMWSFKHDMVEFRKALIVAMDEDSSEQDLENSLTTLKSHNQEEISDHIKKREEQRKRTLADIQQEDDSSSEEQS